MATGNPVFNIFLYLTGAQFRGELQHVGDVSQQKAKCRLIRTREIGGVTLSDVLYGNPKLFFGMIYQVFKWNLSLTLFLGFIKFEFLAIETNIPVYLYFLRRKT